MQNHFGINDFYPNTHQARTATPTWRINSLLLLKGSAAFLIGSEKCSTVSLSSCRMCLKSC